VVSPSALSGSCNRWQVHGDACDDYLTDRPASFKMVRNGTPGIHLLASCGTVANLPSVLQWKRLKPGRTVSSTSDAPAHSSTSSSPFEERSISSPKVPPTYRTRHHSLPDAVPASAPRRASALSDVHGQLYSLHQRQRSEDRRDDPLGLIVLNTPDHRTVDILFIHGLGGTSLRSWCRDRDLDNLWPQLWLPHELPTARILTFGYNTHFASKKEQASSTIGDFATDLLFRMKYGENTPERLGQVPIVVVAHSMGGLVFKNAFLQGHLNSEFRDIMSMIKAVLFLATPHRGTDLAETLNKVLSTSIFGHSPKEYVSELARRSPTIDDLNEAFRHHASKLRIFSFYETLTTAMGPISAMILDKSTAVMGYPSETATPLTANHHNVCKFTSIEDPNYTSVVGALRSVAGVAAAIASPGEDQTASKEDLELLMDFLGMAGLPEEEFASRRSARKQGTCEGFLKKEEVEEWLRCTSGRVLWAHAPPGAGKSTVCSFVIEHLLDAGHHCSYFFFRHGQRHKQSSSSMLRSLAYQTALRVPEFRQALVDLARSGADISNLDGVTVWKKLFSGILGSLRIDEGIYWIIDGVDESDSSKQVVELLSGVSEFESHVRILVFSRPLANISQAFQVARKKLPVTEMPLPDNRSDIRLMVAEEIEYLPSGDQFKAEAVSEIAARSQGNFLWASLVTKRVLECHREDQVKQVLDSTPDGTDRLYDRMVDAITRLDVDEDKALARMLLIWAIYAKTSITVEELSEVHATELKSIMDLSHAIAQVCGQFVAVDPQGRVALVHHSAREYLKKTRRSPFSLEPEGAHEELFGKCLMTLCDKGLRRKINTLKVPQFLPYASTSWAEHLEGSSPDSDRVLDALVRFFGGPYPLAWIQYLAMSRRLSELFGASRKLTTYVRKRKQAEADRSPLLHRVTDLSLLETWAVDMMKLPAKFGRHLSDDPALIYKCIPALSPSSSIIHQKFDGNPAAVLSVVGLSNEEWDDCLARVSGSVGRALRLAASPLWLAVASDVPKGTITIWDTDLFDERKTFCLNEHIWGLAFSKSGSRFACYALLQTHVWKTADWSLEFSTDNPRQERAIEIKFDESDSLVVVSEQRRVYKMRTQGTHVASWERLDPGLLEEPGVPEGTFLSTPSCVAFNNDCTQIAVAYRSFTLSIWSVNPPEMIARLRRKPGQGRGTANSYTGDNKVVWHPSGAHVIGIYGQTFKWSPVDDAYEEAKGESGVIPHGLLCSPNGQVFITMDVGGSIKIYDFASMSLIYKLSSETVVSTRSVSARTMSDSTIFVGRTATSGSPIVSSDLPMRHLNR
jgi:WD40 repeat protein/pimeloyl-ACP methyl ester carboxylesterase